MHLSKFIDYRVKAITNYRGDIKSWGNCQKHLKNHSEWRSDMKGIADFTTAWEAVPNAFVCDGRSVWCHGAQSHFPSDCGMCENAPTKWVHLVEMDFLCFSKTPPLEVIPVPLANAPLCQCWGKWSFECGELQCDCRSSCIPRWLDCHWQWHSRWLHYFHCCCCCPVSFPWCRPSDEAMSSFRCNFATDLNELLIEKIQFVTQVAMTSSKEHCSWMCFSVSTRERESHGSPDMSPMCQREQRKFSLKVFDDGNGEFQRFDDWRFWWWKRKCAFYSFNVSMMEVDMSLVSVDCESLTVMFDVINARLCLWRGKAWNLQNGIVRSGHGRALKPSRVRGKNGRDRVVISRTMFVD